MTKKLIIKSNDNEDWNGTWWKGDVEQEMREVNRTPTGNDWITWILEHVFAEEAGMTSEVEDIIAKCDIVTSVTFRLDNGEVTVTKV